MAKSIAATKLSMTNFVAVVDLTGELFYGTVPIIV